jgi:hypothetical protein
MPRKNWTWALKKTSVKVPEIEQRKLGDACREFISTALVPRSVYTRNPRKKERQCIGIEGSWYRNFFCFTAKFYDPCDNVISTEYEEHFARLEYCGKDKFLCAYMRHTGEWNEITYGTPLSLVECFEMMTTLPHFDVS